MTEIARDMLALFSEYESPKHSKWAKNSAPEVDLSVGANDNICHIRVFRLLSLLELILKKCKSSSKAVNNNYYYYQVTTKVYA